MSEIYSELLEATIYHLQELKGQGIRFVAVAPGTLEALAHPVPQTQLVATPEPRPRPAPLAPAREPAISAPLPPVQKPVTALPAPAIIPGLKSAALLALRERVLPCAKCSHLVANRKNVVFGVGSPEAELMFVGEAPGADEDEQGEPFVGKAGQLLTRIIEATGLTRQSVYVANILKCRPDTPGQVSGNRKPLPAEMAVCLPWLQEQIDIIQPKVLVALGATAVEGLLGKTVAITKFRGNWQVYRGIPLMPTYHPAYLLRNQSVTEKRRVWEDMLQVMRKLGLTPSQKQLNYFK
jgi:uracil-DNA glycosylase family 4